MDNNISLFLEHDTKNTIKVPSIVKSTSGHTYEIQDRINSGGNAVVHQCQHTVTGELFAIKVQLYTSVKMTTRFEQEIQLIESIQHDQLIKYVGTGEIEGTYKRSNKTYKKNLIFLIMELAEKNLSRYLIENNFNVKYAVYIGQFKGLALALATLHEKAIHRDIKPDNILINGDTWLLSDFGLCKYNETTSPELTTDQEKIGPRYWMSPESLNRVFRNTDIISKSSDVYQLCAIYWYVVTGRVPVGVVSKEDWDGPPKLFEVLYLGLSHDPDKRPQDGQELYTLINEAFLTDGSSE